MNHYAYAEKSGKSYKLFQFDEDKPVDGSYSFSALMMSRLDFDIQFTEIPPVNDNEVENLLKYRIRSLYPGVPEGTVFDYKILTQKKHRYAIIFITSKMVLEEYQKLSGGKPLFLPFTLIYPLIQKYADKNCIFLFLNRYWIEAFFFKKGVFLSSTVFKRESSLKKDFIKIESILPQEFNNYTYVILSSVDEKTRFESGGIDFLNNGTPRQFLTIPDRLSSITKKSPFIFQKKQKRIILSQRLKLLLAAGSILLFTGLLINKSVRYNEMYRDKLSSYLTLLESKNLTALTLQKEVEALEEEKRLLNEKRPYNTFSILSELSGILGSNTRILSIIVENDTFQFEGTATNPLGLMERFKTSDTFQDMKLLEIVPLQGTNREKFKVTGIVKAK